MTGNGLMAEILRQGPTGDGYDVRFLASDGQAYVLHFVAAPDAVSVDAAIVSFEAALVAQAEAACVIEAEDGTEV